MLSFFKTNIGIILLILGAIIPFVLSVYEKIAEKKKTRVVLILISTGFIITLCSIIIMNIQDKNRAKLLADLEQKKQDMITTISANVSANLNVSSKSLTLLERLESKFGNTAIQEVAVELSSMDYDNLHVFDKGNLGKMPKYVSWLEETLKKPDSTPVISLTLNRGRHYFLELILAYLLVNKENLDTIQESIGSIPREWRKFPSDQTLKSIGKIESGAKFVLFYDKDKNRLMGYADAIVFTQELLLYKQQGLASKIENMFNEPGKASVSTMQKYFSSFNPKVFKSENAYEAVKLLIEKKANEGVFFDNASPWFISLANVIKLAT